MSISWLIGLPAAQHSLPASPFRAHKLRKPGALFTTFWRLSGWHVYCPPMQSRQPLQLCLVQQPRKPSQPAGAHMAHADDQRSWRTSGSAAAPQDDFRGLKEDARALEGQLQTMKAREEAAVSAVTQAREDADAQRQAVRPLDQGESVVLFPLPLSSKGVANINKNDVSSLAVNRSWLLVHDAFLLPRHICSSGTLVGITEEGLHSSAGADQGIEPVRHQHRTSATCHVAAADLHPSSGRYLRCGRRWPA